MYGVRPSDRCFAASLIEFQQVLEVSGEFTHPLIIVGGQAVGFWANYYLEVEPRLAAFQPFTSKDLDVLATVEQVHRLAAVMVTKGWEFVPPEPDAEAVLGKLRCGDLLVEFLAPGNRPAMPPNRMELLVEGKFLPLRIIHPLMLLAGKIDLAIHIPQDGSVPGIEVRRDLEHIRILCLLIPCYLRNLAAACTDDWSRAVTLQPPISVLASIRRCSGERLDTLYPGACQWQEILPRDLCALPFDDPHRRAVVELTATTRTFPPIAETF